MEHTEALRITKAWAAEVGALAKLNSIEVKRNGAFVAEAGGAFFRYDPDKAQLMVSGLVADGFELFSELPEEWDRLLAASRREQTTLADGNLERVSGSVLRWKPEVIFLTRVFSDGRIDERKFFSQVRWLLEWSTYWRTRRFDEVVMSTDDAALVREAVEINEWTRKNRPRPD